MSSSRSSESLRWRDDLGESWSGTKPYPPIPEERNVDGIVELEELSEGAVIQENEPGRFVWALENGAIVHLGECI